MRAALALQFEAGFSGNPKVAAAGDLAAWLWVRAIDFSALALTNGRLTHEELRGLSNLTGMYTEARPGDQADLLIDAPLVRVTHELLLEQLLVTGLFEETRDGVMVHHFAKHQPTREAILALAGDAVRHRGHEEERLAIEQRRRERDRQRKRERRRAPPVERLRTQDVRGMSHGMSADKTSPIKEENPVLGFELHRALDLSTTVLEQGSVKALSDSNQTEEPVQTLAEDSLEARLAALRVEIVTHGLLTWVVSRLADADAGTAAQITRKMLAWDLDDDHLREALQSLQARNAAGGSHQGDSAYLVGTLTSIGRKRRYRS